MGYERHKGGKGLATKASMTLWTCSEGLGGSKEGAKARGTNLGGFGDWQKADLVLER